MGYADEAVGRVGGFLSQSRTRMTSAVRRSKTHVFLVVTLFFVGVSIWLPWSADRRSGMATVEAESLVVSTDNPGERCRWQKDVEFFASFENQDAPVERETRCVPEVPISVMESKTEAEKSPESDPIVSEQVRAVAAGSPLVAMAPAIARFDKEIVGLIVGIAKKESDFGRHTPKLNGEECFNFWGYRGAGNRGLTPDGYGCFETPEDAVMAIGSRLQELSVLRASTEPARMIVWKCGSSCAGHSPESVTKWISDVDIYYRKLAR